MESERIQGNQTECEKEPLRSVTAEEFSVRLQRFEKSYLRLVIGCACGAALAIVLAVFFRVSVGFVAAIGVAFAYRLLLSDCLKKHLSLTCERNPDGVTVSVVGEWDELWIPARLLWLDVTEVKAACGAECLHIPKSVKRIGASEETPVRIFYEGSAEEWSAVVGNESLYTAELACDAAYPRRPVRARKVDGGGAERNS